MNTRILPTLALAATAALSIPAVGSAAPITFGHRLDHEPSNSAPAHNCAEDGSDTPTLPCTRIPIDGDQGGAVAAGMTAPRSGRIKQFRVRAGAPGSLRFVVVRLKSSAPDSYRGRVVASGPTVNVQGLGFEEDEADAVESFKADVKVKKGDYVGIESSATSALYCSHGGDSQAIFSPALGGAFRTTTQTDGCELLVGAVMKPKRK